MKELIIVSTKFHIIFLTLLFSISSSAFVVDGSSFEGNFGFREDVSNDDPICDSVGTSYFPHHDCTKYYQCVNGELFIRECSLSLYWNPRINTCDFPSQVPECIGGTRPPTGSTTTTTTTTSTTTTTEPSTSTSSPSICDPDRHYYIPYGDNCTMYILCYFGDEFLLACANGTLFDPEQEKCVLEDNYDCPIKTSTTTASTTTTTTTQPSTTTTTTPTPTPTLSTTTLITSSTEYDPFHCPSNNQTYTYLPHPEKCSLFYLCVNGTFQGIYSCSDTNEYWWHSVEMACVLPHESDCTLEPLP